MVKLGYALIQGFQLGSVFMCIQNGNQLQQIKLMVRERVLCFNKNIKHWSSQSWDTAMFF